MVQGAAAVSGVREIVLKKVNVLCGLQGETMKADALILQRFSGLYNTGLSTPHPRGLARRFDFIQAPPVDDLIRFKKEESVIRDEQSFHRFIARIPDKVMDFVRSPPPSNDPLLKRPKIDFDNHMVLVITSYEPNCFIDLDISGIELTSKTMNVHCLYSEPGPVVQKAISYGAYCAVVTRRFDGEVVFVPFREKPSRWAAFVNQTLFSFRRPRRSRNAFCSVNRPIVTSPKISSEALEKKSRLAG